MSTKNNKPTQPEEEKPVAELFLLHLRYKESRLINVGGNAPILLTDPNICWVVYKGSADVFAVSLWQGEAAGARTHLFRVKSGQAVFGMDVKQSPNDVALMVVGGNQTSLLQIDVARLQALAQDAEFGGQVAELVDGWVSQLGAVRMPALPPKECARLDPGQTMRLNQGASVCARRGVLWVRHTRGKSQFGHDSHLPYLNGAGLYPISEKAWIQTLEPSQIELLNTPTFLADQANWFNLEAFHQHVRQGITRWRQQKAAQEQTRIAAKLSSDREIVDEALHTLATPLLSADAAPPPPVDAAERLLLACRLIGERLKIEMAVPAAANGPVTVSGIARASRCQARQVALRGEWWKQDNGHLLAYWEESDQPVALLRRGGQYELHDPARTTPLPVTPEVAEKLKSFAHMFYRPLPARRITALDLLKFGARSERRDLYLLLATGIAVGLLGLIIPMATGAIFDRIIPDGARPQLVQISIALFVTTGAMMLFQIVQNLAVLRLQGRLGADMQAAVWDRLLNLPVSFFRDYSAGDLGTRVMGISTIQQTLSGTVIGAALAGVFSIFSFFLLFYYDRTLALAATLLVGIAVAATLWAGRRQVQQQRRVTQVQGQLSGIVLQTIQGIVKFRAAGTEGRAFANWARAFARLKQATFASRRVSNRLQLFNSSFQIITLMVIFAVVATMTQGSLSTGEFLSFNAAFGQFLVSVLTLSSAGITILSVIPLYERAAPILRTLPEIDPLQKHPGELTGRLEVAHVSFRYSENGPQVLDDVSIRVEPGEFVALVGPSGSGKSTLFRMLLGFETPQAGAVYYDGQNLTSLDVREVRRQLGVVLQNGQIMAGDIYTNIVGSSLLTLGDAWNAAEMAGLDKDVRQMPMGMHTVLSDGGGTLSGGQRQRVLIARALVNRPRILFFDEATSALDNQTQAVVSQSLDNMHATRIVIAHRLSTIMNADRIYVLQGGRVVQSGSYQELMSVEGLFADLARRQMA